MNSSAVSDLVEPSGMATGSWSGNRLNHLNFCWRLVFMLVNQVPSELGVLLLDAALDSPVAVLALDLAGPMEDRSVSTDTWLGWLSTLGEGWVGPWDLLSPWVVTGGVNDLTTFWVLGAAPIGDRVIEFLDLGLASPGTAVARLPVARLGPDLRFWAAEIMIWLARWD